MREYYFDSSENRNNNFSKEKDFDKVILFLDKKDKTGITIAFPHEFSSFLLELDAKTNGRYRLISRSTPLRNLTVKAYLAWTSNNVSPGQRINLGSKAALAIKGGVKKLMARDSFLSEEELALIMLVQLLRIHCSVLYSKDVCPDHMQEFNNLTLSFNYEKEEGVYWIPTIVI